MQGDVETLTSPIDRLAAPAAMPGVIVVFAARQPAHAVTLARGKGKLLLGRDPTCSLSIADPEMSRRHTEIESLGGNTWRITDLGTKNGTWVNGVLVRGGSVTHEGEPLVVRTGGSIVLLDDVARYSTATFEKDGPYVISPRLRVAHDLVIHAARRGATLLVEGESGAGKDQIAELYQAHSKNARGPLVSVNCSAIQTHLAESQLFGSKKGAFTGADADRVGYFLEADKGVLFLDEIATLDLAIQAKLLRVLEDRVVRMVGGAERKTTALFVAATNETLRQKVDKGQFRQDLFMRLGQEHVVLPPLRERREEIPWLIARAANGRSVSPAFVEACLLYPWKGENVRGPLLEVGKAAARAGEGSLQLGHLAPHIAVREQEPELEEEQPTQVEPSLTPRNAEKVEALRARIRDGLTIDDAARAVGVSRATAYRWRKEGLL